MSRLIKIVFIFLGIFFLVGVLVNYLVSRQLKNLPLPKELSKIQGISPKQILEPGKEKENKEYVSPDGKLKLKYPEDWIEIKDEKILEMAVPKENVEKYNLKTLFLAQKFGVTNFAQLIVSQGVLDFPKNIEEIIKEMVESNLQKGWIMEVIESEIKNGVGVFEAIYKKPGRYDARSKEKILFFTDNEGKKGVYLIAFITFDRNWGDFANEANTVIESAQINQ